MKWWFRRRGKHVRLTSKGWKFYRFAQEVGADFTICEGSFMLRITPQLHQKHRLNDVQRIFVDDKRIMFQSIRHGRYGAVPTTHVISYTSFNEARFRIESAIRYGLTRGMA